MKLNEFMDEHYNSLMLTTDLYQQCNLSTYLELGNDIYQFQDDNKLNMKRFNKVYEQIIDIITFLFSQTDPIFVVVNVYPEENKKTTYPNFFKRYVKNHKLKYKLYLQEVRWQFDEESVEVQQMILPCKITDLKIEWLLKTLIHQDFPSLQPRLKQKGSLYAPEIFLVNTNTKCIFHLYDDRGCGVMNIDTTSHQKLLQHFKDLVILETLL